MAEETISINLPDVKSEIYESIFECSRRGLINTTKWLSEIVFCLNEVKATRAPTFLGAITDQDLQECDNYLLAKSFFDCREYERASFFLQDSKSDINRFLAYYAIYMGKEKRRLDNMTDTSLLCENEKLGDLEELLKSLKTDHAARKLDGYMLYLYGIVLKKLELPQLAVTVFIESIHLVPTLWCSWRELAPLVTDREQLQSLNLPLHWMRYFFFGHVLIELYLNDEAMKQYEDLQTSGFNQCVYITSQMAIIYQNKREVEKAIEIFENIQKKDPYRLDNLDIYSNLLFVKEEKFEMAILAQKAAEINKYRPETCCVIGNYFSIRGDHQKAIVNFQRALKLNPQYLSAWTLMGHEFMELKNTNAAIQSYRKAVEVNRRDYRAWYGLGQSYEILRMPFYSLYYYKVAQQLRAYDSRMLVALGETYEKLEKTSNALKCYQRACNVGDIEGVALLKLASLYEKIGDMENAVPAFLNYCADEQSVADKGSLCRAFIMLSTYYEKDGDFDSATKFASKCLEYDEAKSEARSLLKTIENKRSLMTQPREGPNETIDVTPSDDDIDVMDIAESFIEAIGMSRSDISTDE